MYRPFPKYVLRQPFSEHTTINDLKKQEFKMNDEIIDPLSQHSSHFQAQHQVIKGNTCDKEARKKRQKNIQSSNNIKISTIHGSPIVSTSIGHVRSPIFSQYTQPTNYDPIPFNWISLKGSPTKLVRPRVTYKTNYQKIEEKIPCKQEILQYKRKYQTLENHKQAILASSQLHSS